MGQYACTFSNHFPWFQLVGGGGTWGDPSYPLTTQICTPPPFVHPSPPKGRQFPPTPGGLSPSNGSPLGGGGGATLDQPPTTNHELTGAYYVEFMAGQLLVVGHRRLWDSVTCIHADGAMHIMQISKKLNALYPFISFLPAPSSDHGQCKTSSCGPT